VSVLAGHPDRKRPAGITRREFLHLNLAAAAALLTGCRADQPTGETLALVNGQLIDGTGAEAVPDGAVLIEGHRIQAAGARVNVAVPAEARLIDARRGTILPGFINAHVHAAYDEPALKAWAQGGVTTVRDLGASGPYDPGVFDTRDVLRATPGCARLIAAGPFVNVVGGYPIVYWGGDAVAIVSPEDARQAVNQLIDDGADVIKTAFESGQTFGESGWPLLSPETAAALVEAAHAGGRPVTAHVTSSDDLVPALDAGVDEIAHMVVDPLPDEVIARMVEAGTRWVPTLELWHSRVSPVEYGMIAIDNLADFVDAGGVVALGTDYAGAPVDFDLGMPIHEAMWMQEAGMTPAQIIVAATRNGARACNIESDLGTLEAGKLADVLVVDGDPLQDLQALTQVRLVLREGTPV
jgi:imidazolonepropionase-like amidohydrolase